MVDARQCRIIHPFVLQHRGDFIAARRVHQRAAAQIRDASDIGPARHQNDGRGVLEDDGQHDQVAAHHPLAQNAGAADAEIRFAAGNRFGGVDIGSAFADGDVETSITVKALLQRRVVARELELVFPFELQGYLIERIGRMRCEQDQANGYDQPSQHGRLLRKRGQRPCCRCTAKAPGELALSHLTPLRTCLAQSPNYSSLEPSTVINGSSVSGADQV